jgi:hypothetical protein
MELKPAQASELRGLSRCYTAGEDGECMKRTIAFGGIVLLAAACAALRMWTFSVASRWTPGMGELSLPTRVMLAASNVSIRYGAYATLAAIILSPFVGSLLRHRGQVGAAVLSRRFAAWCAVASAFVIAPLLALRTLELTDAISLRDPFWLLLAVAWCLGCAEGFALQSQSEVPARNKWIAAIAGVSVAAVTIALQPLGLPLVGLTVACALWARHPRAAV